MKILNENIFLSEEVAALFAEQQLDIVYISELESLFAVSTIQFPTNDNPFIKFSGFLINEYVLVSSNVLQLRNKLKIRMEKPMQEFTLQTNKWFFMKDKMALFNLNKKKF